MSTDAVAIHGGRVAGGAMALVGGHAHAIDEVGARTRGEQPLDDGRGAGVGRRHQRRHAFERRLVDVGAFLQHRLDDREVALLGGEQERGLAQAIARRRRRAGLEDALDLCEVALARTDEQLRVQGRIARRLRRRGERDGERCEDAGAPQTVAVDGRGHRDNLGVRMHGSERGVGRRHDCGYAWPL